MTLLYLTIALKYSDDVHEMYTVHLSFVRLIAQPLQNVWPLNQSDGCCRSN